MSSLSEVSMNSNPLDELGLDLGPVLSSGYNVGDDLPGALHLFEEGTAGIDLSDIEFDELGYKKLTASLTVIATAGTLDAEQERKLVIEGAGTDRMTFTGQIQEIQKYFRDDDALTFTGAQDVFGDGAGSVELYFDLAPDTWYLGTIEVDIQDVADNQTGTAGDDVLTGDGGINLLDGLAGNDWLTGLDGNDVILGGDGNDTVSGGGGADDLSGGAGEDVLYYFESPAGVTVNLTEDMPGLQSASGGDADGDVISGFEHVYGSEHADVIAGNSGRNILFGYAGNDLLQGFDGDDVIRGGAGADTLEGGAGQDWVRYLGSDAGVTVSLAPGAVGQGGDAQGDVISGFEHIQGSDEGDALTGDAGDNYIIGFAGNDVIDAGAGDDTVRGGAGADTMTGGDGIDRLQYFDSASGVTIDLRADASGLQGASGGDAEGDVISGFENVFASDHADSLTGDALRNYLFGYDGDDSIAGGEGKDVLRGDSGADSFIFDTALVASNVDRVLDFEDGSDMLVLDGAVFNFLSTGALGTEMFHASATGDATTEAQRILYETDTGVLSYDSDGTGANAAVAFAQLTTRPTLDADDFMIV